MFNGIIFNTGTVRRLLKKIKKVEYYLFSLKSQFLKKRLAHQSLAVAFALLTLVSYQEQIDQFLFI